LDNYIRVLIFDKVFAMAYSFCQYAQIRHGAGRHLSAILREDPSDTVESQKWAFAAQIVAGPALALPKFSICLTYLRLFHTDIRGRRLIKGVATLVLIPLVLFTILSFFQCRPIQAYWTEGRPASKCNTDISGIYVSGSLNVFVDLALMAIVLPRVLELHLNARQKWALIGIVGLGSFAAMAGLTRMIRVGTTLTKLNFDATWDAYDISIWTSTEIYVSLICASAPGMKPVVAKMLPKLLDSTLSNQSQSKTTLEPPGSIEFCLKERRGTIGSNRVRPKRATTFGDDEGFYQQIGRGIDSRVSADGGKRGTTAVVGDDFPALSIVKTSEVSIRTSVLPLPRHDASGSSPSPTRRIGPFAKVSDRNV
jgi:hypothetical protein